MFIQRKNGILSMLSIFLNCFNMDQAIRYAVEYLSFFLFLHSWYIHWLKCVQNFNTVFYN